MKSTFDAAAQAHGRSLVFLDSCYSIKSKRLFTTTTSSIVEIISATDDSAPGPLIPRSRLSGRLRDEIMIRERRGHQSVEFADLMQSIRAKSQVDHPTHSLKRGVSSVRLSLRDGSIIPETIAPCLRAVFTIQLEEDVTKEELALFVCWTRNLPPKCAITLDGAYKAKSTLLSCKVHMRFSPR